MVEEAAVRDFDLTPGVPTTAHWRVGLRHYVLVEKKFGVCVSVTPWGRDKIRWVRLRLEDGTEKSFPPSGLQHDPDDARTGPIRVTIEPAAFGRPTRGDDDRTGSAGPGSSRSSTRRGAGPDGR